VNPSPSEAGFQPNRDYLALLPFELIDTASDNVMLSFMDLALPGDAGRQLKFVRMFSNNVAEEPTGPQWRFGIEGVPMRVVERPYPQIPIQPPGNIQAEQLTTPYFWMLDGSRMKTAYVNPPDPSNPSTLDNVRSHTFWHYNRPSKRLSLPDGTIAEYCAQTDVDCRDGYLKRISDPFGNTVSLAWAPGMLQVVQYLGDDQSRQIDVQMDDATGLPTTLTYNGRTWTYAYPVPGQLATVAPPLGPPWRFEYSTEQFSSGKLMRVTTPQNGAIEYTYEDREFYTGGTPSIFNVLASRRLYDDGQAIGPAWTFTHYPGQGTDLTEVTLPSGTKVIYVYGAYSNPNTLAGTWQLRFRYVQAPDGSTVEQEERQYTDLLKASRREEPWGVPHVARRLITRAGQTHATEYTYSPNDFPNFHEFHRPLTITERGPGGTVQRTTQLTYRHLTTMTYVLGLPATESTTIDGMTASKSWDYEPATGFRERETLYGISTTFSRDTFGNVAKVKKANTKETSYTYSWGTVEDTITPGVVIDRSINQNGLVESETIAGRTTIYGYDDLFRPTRTEPPTGSNPTVAEYDNTTGRGATVRRGSSFTTTTTDGFGRPVRSENSVGIRTRMGYDAEGRKTYQSYSFAGEYGGPDDRGTEFAYDALGRPILERNPDNTTRTREYDDADNRVTLRDEENRATVLTFRGFGHPDDARLISVVDANEQPWSYSYDAIGNLAQMVTPTGATRTWLRNTSGLVTSETHPESGQTLYTFYDAAGVLKRKVDANGTEFIYQHDDNDRVTTITAGTRVTTIAYEPGSDNPIETSNGAVSTTFGYDGAGRLRQRRDVVGAFVFDSGYTYDGNDQVAGITYPSGRFIEYTHDTEGRITRVFETAAGRDYAFGMTYHPSGGLATYTTGNNIATVIGYDPDRDWIRSITAGPLQLTHSNYDRVGNVLAIDDSRSGYSQTFTYDSLDRLTTATGVYGFAGYAYDPHGNRQSAYGSTYTYDDTLRLTSQNGVPFTYDSNGNLTSKATTTFTYTPENWLGSVTEGSNQTTYAYDAGGWRAKKTTATETTYYLRSLTGELLTEWHNLGATARVRDYVYAGTRLVSAIDRTQDPPTTCGGESIPDGLPHRVSIASGATGAVSFEGSACRRVSVKVVVVSGNLGCWDTRVQKNGTTIPNGNQSSCSTPGFLEPVVLPASGSYSVVVDPSGTGSGTVDIYIYDVVDVTDPITPNGPAISAPLLTPGQRAVLPFSGTAGRRMSVKVSITSGSFGCFWYIRIQKDGATIPGGQQVSCAGVNESGFFEPVALPSDGTYTVVVDPQTSYTGSATVTLYAVVDVTDPITANGSAISAPLLTPGQRAVLPFSGTGGRRMSVKVTTTSGNFGCIWYIRIQKDGATIPGGEQVSCAGVNQSAFLEPVALPSDGTYTVVVDPQTSYTGSGTVNLHDVVDVTESITPGGAAVSISLDVPGQRAHLAFSGSAGQQVSATVRTTSGNFGCLWYILIQKDGSTITGGSKYSCAGINQNVTLGPVTLPSLGTYTVVVDPNTSSTGWADVTLTNVP
jgi:YD repeat-containing protein